MKEIPLTQGKIALVDDEDYSELSKHKWSVYPGKYTCYAHRGIRINGKLIFISMHAAILKTPKGLDCDHINGNGLDNRRGNIRIVTRRGNLQNQKNRNIPKSSKFPGVFWNKKKHKWEVKIRILKRGSRFKREHHYLGRYEDEDVAATVYKVASAILDEAELKKKIPV